ncbi:hypothetical protein [Pseudomonas sp. EL_65y_Pfl2_R95]|uniref:hypothetical protein n=1 Tax=Pseudomonas sp. EL_65y_Pfl2_R95 TaxID=3088698 RepID=UPI0030DD2766
MTQFTVNYHFNNEARSHELDLEQSQLSEGDAARHLIELHHADAENSLLMPAADASEDELLAQAEVLAITDIRVAS